MSLPYAILGLLAEGPKSGYELVREFDYARSVIWPAPQNEIYRELAKLAKAGAIAAEEEPQGPRGRRRYRILEAGRRRLKDWLLKPEADFTLRYEPILRAVFFGRLEEDEVRRRLEADLPFYRRQVEVLEKAEAGSPAAFADDPRRHGRRQALGLYRSLADWSEAALARITVSDTDGGWDIRPAGGDDARLLAMLGAQVFLDTYATEGIGRALASHCAREFTEGRFLELLRGPRRAFFVAHGPEGAVGYAHLDLDGRTALADAGRQAELVQLYVSRHHARRGAGRALLARAAAHARTDGAGLLWLSAYHGNRAALAFYRRLGFADIGRLDFDLDGELHENRVLSLPLYPSS